jgi:tRNA A-37 threonylcarbamoyl transferase component Bud32/Tfp pilus assembly protein PilF
MPEDLPERFGPYQVEGRLGAGGMGQVYRARDTRLGREVAVKVIAHEKADDPGLQARFEREARAASALNHPNIVSVYDVGEQDGTHYIVTELVHGESLRQIISRGPLAPDQLARLASQIADALKAAHAGGIVHRDLKPENIMVTPEGRVKILDFGLARRVKQHVSQADNTVTLATTTQPGTIVGTAGYMSPEQICGEEIDHRSDIFSAGLVFYEMAAGARAFRGRTSIEVMSAVLKDEPADLPGSSSAVMNRIIRRCMEKDPVKRYQSATELDAALEGATSGSGWFSKHWPWVGLAAAGVVIAAGAYWRMERKVPAVVKVPDVPVSARHAETAPPEQQTAALPVPVVSKASSPPKTKAPEPKKQEKKPDPARIDPAKVANDEAYQRAYEQGMLLLGQRNWAEAEDRLSEAIRLKPDGPSAYMGRCRAAGMKLDDQQAIADCTEVIRRVPDSADAFHERGTAYLRNQQYERAIADIDAAIRFGDQNPAGAHSVRGRAHNGLEQWDAAMEDFDEAIRLNPKVAQFFMFRGVTRNARREFAKAIEDFNEALRLQPNLPLAYSHRATAKARTGDKEGAAADRKQAKELRK